MPEHAWIQSFPGAVTVCDQDGIILEMNDKAIQAFASDGGEKLIGTNLWGCHSEESRKKLRAMIANEQSNIYTIEKKGVKKLIYQVPWYAAGVFAGFVELSLEIPFEMPHFVRG
ncbi:MAG: PAS domain-containing protein [Bellilinea sp.]